MQPEQQYDSPCFLALQGMLEAQVKDTEIVLPLYEPSPQVCTAPATAATAATAVKSSCIVCLLPRIHVLGFGIPSALYFACKQVCRQKVACSSALASKQPLPCLPLDPPHSTPSLPSPPPPPPTPCSARTKTFSSLHYHCTLWFTYPLSHPITPPAPQGRASACCKRLGY